MCPPNAASISAKSIWSASMTAWFTSSHSFLFNSSTHCFCEHIYYSAWCGLFQFSSQYFRHDCHTNQFCFTFSSNLFPGKALIFISHEYHAAPPVERMAHTSPVNNRFRQILLNRRAIPSKVRNASRSERHISRTGFWKRKNAMQKRAAHIWESQ